MLSAALEHYRQQQRISALAVRQARRDAASGLTQVATAIGRYQATAIALTLASTPAELSEQSISAPPVASVNPAALLTPGAATVGFLEAAATAEAFDRLVASLVQDAGRTAAAVDIARRPKITGYVRSLNLPSCSRCAILAGRVYRYSQGFQRHPLCDCLMTPTTQDAGQDLVLDPTDAIERGQVKGLSKADMQALNLGADLGRVVNVRRTQAGLSVGSSVVARGGRLTPQGVMNAAPDRESAIALLRANGYLT